MKAAKAEYKEFNMWEKLTTFESNGERGMKHLSTLLFVVSSRLELYMAEYMKHREASKSEESEVDHVIFCKMADMLEHALIDIGFYIRDNFDNQTAITRTDMENMIKEFNLHGIKGKLFDEEKKVE